ncbi:MAG: squalene synthase HpnC [Burkholderiales bacterium]
MSVDHYENFPVASLVLPARLRAVVTDIYWFAREADDIADEGDVSPAERLAGLHERVLELDRIERAEPPLTPLFDRLSVHIRAHRLPIGPFRDLLDAFKQDVTKHRYADFGEVMSYCRRSANPVGRLLLHLFGETHPRALALSDGICSSLQLVNFLQDIAGDYRRGRIYLPLDELARHGLDESAIAAGEPTAAWSQLMREQIGRARRILMAGAPLGRVLKGRPGFEIRMIVAGGLRVLEKLTAVDGDVFHRRPTLGALDWPRILVRASFGR